MNSEELQTIKQQIADVELPPQPDWQPLVTTIIVVTIAVVLAALVIRLRSRRKGPNKISDTKREAIYQLQKLHRQWQAHEVDDHDAAYRLATLLRLGLELSQLTDTPPSKLQIEQNQWRDTIQLLTRLRYQQSGTEKSVNLSSETFIQIEEWLKREETPC